MANSHGVPMRFQVQSSAFFCGKRLGDCSGFGKVETLRFLRWVNLCFVRDLGS